MGRYLRVYRVIGSTFGIWIRPLGAFALLQLRQAISAITLGLDYLFYPRHRKQVIDRPIFIIGNPRSGTITDTLVTPLGDFVIPDTADAAAGLAADAFGSI